MIPFDTIAASGDIIQNLRSSLDHLAYQLVMVGTDDVGPKNVRRIQFPIAEDFAAYETRKAVQVEGMRDDAKCAIDAAKPYKGGNDNLWHITNSIISTSTGLCSQSLMTICSLQTGFRG